MKAPKPADLLVLAAAEKAVKDSPGKTPTQAVRELQGLSQEELARRAGVDQAAIVRLENGQSCGALLLACVSFALDVPDRLLETKPRSRGYPS